MITIINKLRRLVLAVPVKVWACLITVGCLALTLVGLHQALHLVRITDSEGASEVVMTHLDDPQQLMQLSGIVAEEGDDVHYTAYKGNQASLSIQRALDLTVTADGQPTSYAWSTAP